jgi:hypothetical protein
MAIWNKRSEHDLIGNGIGVSHGQWLQPGFSGVGAGIDSFFEYGMKAAILLSGSWYSFMEQRLMDRRRHVPRYLSRFVCGSPNPRPDYRWVLRKIHALLST